MSVPAIVWYLLFIGSTTGFLAWSYMVLREPSFLLQHDSKAWKVVINVLYVLVIVLISGIMSALSWLVITAGAWATDFDLTSLDKEMMSMIYASAGGLFGAIGTHIWMMLIRSSTYAADKVEGMLMRKADDYTDK